MLNASQIILSHPIRVRGLKLADKAFGDCDENVAPYTGAWIETVSSVTRIWPTMVAPYTGAWIETATNIWRLLPTPSHPIRVRGLKLCFRSLARCGLGRTLYGCVDWNQLLCYSKSYATLSHPIRVRGLKPLIITTCPREISVAPYTGAWIETYYGFYNQDETLCRTLYGCVDWNFLTLVVLMLLICRTLYGCVDWNLKVVIIVNIKMCRTLYGCVDWNS